jgi:hypothetical protein
MASIADRTLRKLGPAAASAFLLTALCALFALAGCAGDPHRARFDSHTTYDRTFDTVVGAMADQKLVIGQQDRRRGTVVGTEAGVTVSAELLPQVDGLIQVRFEQTGPSASGPAVLKKVADSYEARMARLKLLGGFSDR